MRAVMVAVVLLAVVAPGALAKGPNVAATDDNAYNPRYEPFELTAAPGATLAVANTGSDRHTLTPVQQGAWTEVELAAGANGTFVAPSALGDYRFYCRFHASPSAPLGQGMSGVLHVQAAKATPLGADATLLALALAGPVAATVRRRRAR